jgi:hypothetical protein
MPRDLQPCGTPAAYMRHLRRGEDPCGPCRKANAARTRAIRHSDEAVRPCACCGLPGVIVGHGWRMSCHQRWIRAGKPESGPPPSRLWVRDEYEWLRGGGVSPEQAAERVGTTRQQAYRWERRRRKAVAA